ncbi:uncharacterized protein LOC123541752 isoform X4 [Mercenaria mercenaria]|uniref:uncharacterized protein LOC123541752 isoform X4 n=1 Tax=Mercenaria mercenaria TaxID=6596 RepID=UPI00234E9B9B|nr:uncharacterized protein LOC123541752 isoform X4 [Mercenaria mercenaria]
MAKALSEFDKIRGFAKVLRNTKYDIDKEFTVEVSPVLSESKFTNYTVQQLDEGIRSMEEVLDSLNDISKSLHKIKEDFQDAKIQVLEKQLQKAQVRDQPGRSMGLRNDSGCFSADSRVLSSGSILVTQPSDADLEEDNSSTSRAVNSVHTEPTQHEDTSQLLNKDGDSIC